MIERSAAGDVGRAVKMPGLQRALFEPDFDELSRIGASEPKAVEFGIS